MNRRYITLPMLLLVLSLSSGCGTTEYRGYEGPSLPESQVAVLSLVLFPPLPGDFFCIREIDGKPTGTRCLGSGQLDIRFELLPGPHTVSALHDEQTGGRRCFFGCPNLSPRGLLYPFDDWPRWTPTEEVLTFEAEAGHTYDIGPFWIKDTTTGEIVSRGKTPAEKAREKLFEKFLVDAEKGDREAQFQLYRGSSLSGKSLTWLCLAANQGYTPAQEEFGDLYAGKYGGDWSDADFAEPDRVRAYMWYSLAASSGHRRAGFTRNRLGNQMTPAQIAEAERLAAEWKPGDCGAEDRTAKSTK